MFNMPKPFRAEFRRDVVAVARKHEAPISQIAKDLGISEATLHNWLSAVRGDFRCAWMVRPLFWRRF
jgi:transposase-like protein